MSDESAELTGLVVRTDDGEVYAFSAEALDAARLDESERSALEGHLSGQDEVSGYGYFQQPSGQSSQYIMQYNYTGPTAKPSQITNLKIKSWGSFHIGDVAVW